MGYVITSRWLTEHNGMPAEQASTEDLEDIDKADALVLFTMIPEGGITGGREFESGYAYAKGKKLYLVGDQVNVFHSKFPAAHRYENLAAFLKAFEPCGVDL